jgi:hypothetical protein
MFSRTGQMKTGPHLLAQESRIMLESFGSDRSSRIRAILLHVILIAVFGIFLPWQKGLDFLDPVITAAYVCLSVIFAAPAVAQTFSTNRPATMSAAIVRVLIAVAYGECVAWAMLIAGVATVGITHGFRVLLPELDTLAMAGALGVAASFALALAAAWISLFFSARAARAVMRVVFLLLLGAFFYWSRWLPDVAGRGALIALALSAGMIVILNRAFAQ